jgi:TetR/AcrR family transcriptional repressor of nem operon
MMTKGEQTRQRIIEQSVPVFNQRGFAGSSMQDIMDATGMEKGGLYRHFSSKEELAVEAFRFALANVVRTRTEKVEEIQGAVEKLRHLIDHFVETPSIVPGGCPLMNTAIDSDDGNEALRALACDGFQRWKARLCRIVEAGMEQGEIRNDVEPRRIANTIVATLEGALMISRLEGSMVALEDARDSLEIVLRSLESRA